MAQTKSAAIALAGNPNVGKSTLFNALTGLHQHTGNWPGKTVASARGAYIHAGKSFELIDLPGTYSLFADSPEEEITRDFLLFGGADVTLLVADATALERNLLLLLQVMEVSPRVVLCVNLLDEAKKKGITVDLEVLRTQLGIPVVGVCARDGQGLDAVRDVLLREARLPRGCAGKVVEYALPVERAISMVEPALAPWTGQRLPGRHLALRLLEEDSAIAHQLRADSSFAPYAPAVEESVGRAAALLRHADLSGDTLRDSVVTSVSRRAGAIFRAAVKTEGDPHQRDRRLDRLLTSPTVGVPVMLLLLGLIFYLTIAGANVPSAVLERWLFSLTEPLRTWLDGLGAPAWLTAAAVDGVYRTSAWVVAVMLPPMAIFFPLFTLLEDMGYLPRVAFNLDRFFERAGAHGRQSLTMCMGLGCNACGVTGCRIIMSPRERLIAILTNVFMPCNGRFPTLIALLTVFFARGRGPFAALGAAAGLLGLIVLAVCATLLTSRLLSRTALRGEPSGFSLELPPYRVPRLGQVILRSIFDRTLFVLGRAVTVAAPAGLVIWLLANCSVGGETLLFHLSAALDPLGRVMGLSGAILLAFLMAFPANEIMLPALLMCYLSAGSLTGYESLEELGRLLTANGWSVETALCAMVFCLMHFPCSTTCLTIWKETKSGKWTLLAVALPTVLGILCCCAIHAVFTLI